MSKVARGVFVVMAMIACVVARAEEPPEGGSDSCESQLKTSQDVTREAAERLTAYTAKMKSTLIERDKVIDLFVLGLLTQEHVLLLGPRGVAKTMAAEMFFKNIMDSSTGKPSVWSIHMTPETTLNDTHGPYDWNRLQKDGVFRRILSEGVLGYRYAFIDEFFDGNPKLMRNMLRVMNERSHSEGGEIYPGKTESMVLASNLYLSQVFQRAERLNNPDGPEAVIDRIAFIAFIPKDFSSLDSDMRLMNLEKNMGPMPPLSTGDVEHLRQLMGQVEVPDTVKQFVSLLSNNMESILESVQEKSKLDYQKKIKEGEMSVAPPFRATKFHSKRTLGKIPKILRALVVKDWVEKKGDRDLIVTLDDVKKLEMFLTLNGPDDGLAQEFMGRAVNLNERAQLLTVIKEREVFHTVYNQILDGVSQVSHRYSLGPLAPSFQVPKDEAARLEVAKSLLTTYLETSAILAEQIRPWENSPQRIGVGIVHQFVERRLMETIGPNYKAWIQQVLEQMRKAEEEARQRAEEEARRLEEEKRLREIAAEQQKVDNERQRRLDITSFRSQIGEVEVQIQTLRKEKEPLLLEHRKQEDRLARIKKQITQNVEKRNWHNEEISHITERLARLNKNPSQNTQQIEAAQRDLDGHKEELRLEGDRLKNLEAIRNEAADELSRMATEIKQIDDHIQQGTKRIESLRTQIQQATGLDGKSPEIVITLPEGPVRRLQIVAKEALEPSAVVNSLVDGQMDVLDPLKGSSAVRFDFDSVRINTSTLSHLPLASSQFKSELKDRPGLLARVTAHIAVAIVGNELVTFVDKRIQGRMDMPPGAYYIQDSGHVTALVPVADGLNLQFYRVSNNGRINLEKEEKVKVSSNVEELVVALKARQIEILPHGTGWILKSRQPLVSKEGQRLHYTIDAAKDLVEVSSRGSGWEVLALEVDQSRGIALLEIHPSTRRIALRLGEKVYLLELPSEFSRMPDTKAFSRLTFETRTVGNTPHLFAHISLTGREWVSVDLTEASSVRAFELPVDETLLRGVVVRAQAVYFVVPEAIQKAAE